MIAAERIRKVIDFIAAGHSQREAERLADVSHSTFSRYVQHSRLRENAFVFDGHYLFEHVEAARMRAAELQQVTPWPRRGASQFERVAQPEPEELSAHAVELLDSAPPGVVASDPLLNHPRAHWSANGDLRPQLADAVDRGTLGGRIDGGGYGRQAPPQDPTRTLVSTRRYNYSERVKTGPLTVHIIKK